MQPLMVSPDQVRAARALLRWTRLDLASKSSVPAVTIKGYELLGADSKVSTVQKMRRALESAGIEFIEASGGKGPGVRYARDGESKKR